MYCQSCGNKVEVNDLFCNSCGTKKSQAGRQGEIKDTIKESAHYALSSLKQMAANPVGNLQNTFESLEKQKAIGVGIVFAVVFNLLFSLGLYFAFRKLVGDFMSYVPAGTYFKLILAGFVPFVGIAASSALLRQIFHSRGGLESDVFISGVALLPSGICILLSGLVGVMNVEVIAILSAFALSYTILVLFTGFTRILKISDANAAIVVPATLLASAWMSKIIVAAMLPKL
jgi:hypothetical protein